MGEYGERDSPVWEDDPEDGLLGCGGDWGDCSEHEDGEQCDRGVEREGVFVVEGVDEGEGGEGDGNKGYGEKAEAADEGGSEHGCSFGACEGVGYGVTAGEGFGVTVDGDPGEQ